MTVMEDGVQVKQPEMIGKLSGLAVSYKKISLDELPQFINVLQGSMSIISPRLHTISHNEIYRYRRLIEGCMIRHKVKPGITGWAQIEGFHGETDAIEKTQARIDYDLDYLRNWPIF